MSRILILGGTRFLGRSLTEAALERGHEVTLFHRGKTGAELFPALERCLGDRSHGDLSSLRGRSWDVVLDVPTDQPSWVKDSCQELSGRVGCYVYISSISVLEDLTVGDADETAAVATCPESELLDPPNYGARKARCEDLVREAFPESHWILRPGLVVGPHDPSDRFSYWPSRIHAGGDILCPPQGGLPTQWIDVRDLAGWIVEGLERGIRGTFFATGPKEPTSISQMLETLRQELCPSARFHEVSEEDLARLEVHPWIDLPCFVGSSQAGLLQVDTRRAQAQGLRLRPLLETARDVLAWDSLRPPGPRLAGLSREREANLLFKLGRIDSPSLFPPA